MTSEKEKLSLLAAEVAKMRTLGCRLAQLGEVYIPDGYEIMRNPDGHFFWIDYQGRTSASHWSRWVIRNAAIEEAKIQE